jgi:hypothetical protein
MDVDAHDTLLLPVRVGAFDWAVVEGDLLRQINAVAVNGPHKPGSAGLHVLPIGHSHRECLKLRDRLAETGILGKWVGFSVVEPGIPALDPLDLHLWIGGGEFAPNSQECFYAMELADTAWRCSDMQI